MLYAVSVSSCACVMVFPQLLPRPYEVIDMGTSSTAISVVLVRTGASRTGSVTEDGVAGEADNAGEEEVGM